jgi:hypothetical protein|uniref:Metal-dependent hydrolase n=1 Tax=Desulfobacca acetoxidans TaxID=60893 RepID=A0A7V6A2G8_9BACT
MKLATLIAGCRFPRGATNLHDFQVIDSHLHCGRQNVSWLWEDLRAHLAAAGIGGAALIPPVEDVYDRHNPHFTDTPEWQACRRRAHQYVLDLTDPDITIYPYFFVWNDFALEGLVPRHIAVKWHRHGNEPEYRYDDPRCREFLEAVQARGIPILLEETLPNTLYFIEELVPSGVPVIIPHLGALSGGYRPLERAGVWERPHMYADTAVADVSDIEDYLARYGHSRLLYGSDFPFSLPEVELQKILDLNLPWDVTQAILGDNFRRLCHGEM